MKQHLYAATIIFSCLTPFTAFALDCRYPAKISSTGYYSIKDAYTAGGGGAVIKLSGADFHRENVAASSKAVTLSGGWDCGQASQVSKYPFSEITGTLTISGAGSVIADRIALRPATAPANVSGTQGTGTCFQATLTWSNVPGAIGYTIYQVLDPNTTFTGTTASTSALFDEALSPGVSQTYRVSANLSGAVDTPMSLPAILWAKPVVPTNVSATRGTYPSKVRISWDTMSCAGSYWTYYSSDNVNYYCAHANCTGGSWPPMNTTCPYFNLAPYNQPPYTCSATPVSPNTTNFKEWNMGNSNHYYFKVTSMYTVNATTYETLLSASPSVEGWQTASPPSIPPAPTGLSATDCTLYHQITVTWNAVAGASNYKIYRAASPWGPWTNIINPVSSPFYDTSAATPWGLNYWGSYFYKISAVVGGVEGYLSNYEMGCAGSMVLFP